MERRDVVGFSRGVTSAVVAWLVAQEHPTTTILLFHDPKEEPSDNDRFMAEVSAYLGLPVTEDSDGRSVSELFEDEGLLGNNQMAPCSRVLKHERSFLYAKRLTEQGFAVTVCLGFTSDEMDRFSRAIQRYASIGVTVRAPLIEKGWAKDDCLRMVTDCWGIAPPKAYEHFEHANCRGCVKGGLAYWGQVYTFDREMWEQRAQMEDDFQHTILHSRYGGYPEGSLRTMLPRCLEAADKWRRGRAQGLALPLIELPCACAV